MPDVRMPDGTIVKNVPEGTTRAQLQARVVKAQPQKADARPASFWQGVKEGAAEPLFNMANFAEYLADKAGIKKPLQDFGRAINPGGYTNGGVDKARQTFAKTQSAAPNKGSGLGTFVGNMAGTLPTAALPGGPFMQGAYSTGLLTRSREPDLIAAEMAMGGLMGKAGDRVIRGAARKIAPSVSKAMAELGKKGVRVTPGQATRESQSIPGRLLTAFEDRATSLPGPTGQLVRAGRERASEDFVLGGVNDLLGDIGKSLPKGTPAGHQSVAFAQKAASGAYDDALVGMNFVPDPQFGGEARALIDNARNGGLSKPHFKQFGELVRNVVMRRAEANGGSLSGDSFKTVMSELRQKGSKFGSSSVASEQEYGAAVSALADAIEEGARRSSNPQSVAALDAADRAYAKLVRVEGAAKNAPDGIFSPAQLATSIRQADSSVRKRAVAAGEGLMQDYASAGRKILPSAIGDSGTGGRDAMWSPTPWLVDLASYFPYRAAQAVTPHMAGREAGPAASGLAELLRLTAPTLSKATPVAGYSLFNER